jgi:hypothetical protein
MSTRTVRPDKSLPELGPELNAAWETWLARHGLPEPKHICYGGPIVCDDDARTVSAWCKAWTESGADKVIKTGDPSSPYEVVREWVVVQLEAPALPFPAGYEVITG